MAVNFRSFIPRPLRSLGQTQLSHGRPLDQRVWRHQVEMGTGGEGEG